MLILPLIQANQRLFLFRINSHRNHLPIYCSLFFQNITHCAGSVCVLKNRAVFLKYYILSELVCSFVVLPKCAAQERVVIIHENQQLYIGFAVKRTCVFVHTSCISLYEYHLPQCIIDT